MDPKGRLRRKLTWRVKERATTDRAAEATPAAGEGGSVVFEDEHGRPRRLPANLDELTPEQRDAAIGALSQALGAAPPDAARLAAIERLTELRAAGKLTEEQFQKERRRLESY
jgi:hypothetical protein